MNLDTILQYNLDEDDYIELYTWEELLSMAELEEDIPYYQIKNQKKRYVLPNSWRLFEEESHKYGTCYKIRSSRYNDFYKRLQTYAIGKGEINYLEIKHIYKKNTEEWKTLIKKLKKEEDKKYKYGNPKKR